MTALPEDECHDTACECRSFHEEWEVESGWRCRDCRTLLSAPRERLGTSRSCKSCTLKGRTQ